ncbi:1,4-alpha-glucan branching protein GlgB [Saccharopolyspora sp. NPDC003762]
MTGRPPAVREYARLLDGSHPDPHTLLGAHRAGAGTVFRTVQPGAQAVAVRCGSTRYELLEVMPSLFVGQAPLPVSDHRLEVRRAEGVVELDDPYRWLPTLGELDLHLIGEGRHERLWEVLGAHRRSLELPDRTVRGAAFAVWAPDARGVRVVGDFNGWDGTGHPMRALGTSGVWELFVPGVEAGCRYKFQVLGVDGRWRDKADPMAFAAEPPPGTASVLHEPGHEWHDADWLRGRGRAAVLSSPMSIYEVHLGSWRKGLTYRELADRLGDYLADRGYTHVELLPVAEHPYGGSWGYQVTSYYSPTARFGSPDDFRYFVDRLHQRGIGVILDWVPAHFPRDAWALARFTGQPQYEHPDPQRGEHPDWGTLVFDFGRPEVRNFLLANALYWIEEFHVDGLRVDAVASMLYLDYSRGPGQWSPNRFGGRENLEAVQFLRELNATVHEHHPGVVMIAEESTAWPGVTAPADRGLGFDLKWNMGWMHDTLSVLSHDPVERRDLQDELTFALSYAWTENFVLALSHDEVVHGKGSLWGKMPGNAWLKAANLRALLGFTWAHPGKQLLFMGGEFGQAREWADNRSLDWGLLTEHADADLHRGLDRLVTDLNHTYAKLPALYTWDFRKEGFSWIVGDDADRNVVAFLRHGADGSVVACVANFAGVAHDGYRIGLPAIERWREVLNTDAREYGGSGVGNPARITADDQPWHSWPASAVLRLPPCGVVWLAPER